MQNKIELTYVAKCRKTGANLRPATPAEIAGYHAANAGKRYGLDCFARPAVVDGVLIDTYTGPGIWFGGAGF